MLTQPRKPVRLLATTLVMLQVCALLGSIEHFATTSHTLAGEDAEHVHSTQLITPLFNEQRVTAGNTTQTVHHATLCQLLQLRSEPMALAPRRTELVLRVAQQEPRKANAPVRASPEARHRYNLAPKQSPPTAGIQI